MTTLKYGLIAGPHNPTQTDLDVFASLGFGAVKLLCGVHSPTAISAFRNSGAFILQARIHYPEVTQGRSPQQFVEDRRDAIGAFINEGLGDFEVLHEPNLSREGYGKSWGSAEQFKTWYLEALSRLKGLFPQARFGFPALSPGPAVLDHDAVGGGAFRPVGDVDFLEVCNDAVLASDFLCVHSYWQNITQMRDIDANNIGLGGLRFVRLYHERFPTKSISISEFCNDRPGVGEYAPDDAQWRVIGDEYAEFYTLCAQYEFVEAVFARTLRDGAFPDQSWLTDDFRQRRIIEGVKSRPPVPDRNQLSLYWPTQFQRVNQPYGMRQADYMRYSGGNLRGGHEGIDIAATEGTDIYAALGGTVIRSEASRGNFNNGYGAYGEVISIESNVPGVGKVTLTYAHFSQRLVQRGQTVRAGDRIGFAGATGNAQGAHLHLSMRVSSIPLYCQLDYINPGLYLNYDSAPPAPPPPAPGTPRVQYVRTVVLLPPPAGVDFVEAVLRATWDRFRLTVGGSGDDGGVGDLERRRVIAVNPTQWNGDLQAWYAQHYPGVEYLPINAATAPALQAILASINLGEPAPYSGANRGQPREQYSRTYLLIPPNHGVDWAVAAARATWAKHRLTIGGSSDDGGIGALNSRRVIALNPTTWGGDLQAWYSQNYPGVQYVPVTARDTGQFVQALSQLFP